MSAVNVGDPMLAIPLKRVDSLDWVRPLKSFIKETVNEHEAECSSEALEKMNRLRKAVKDGVSQPSFFPPVSDF